MSKVLLMLVGLCVTAAGTEVSCSECTFLVGMISERLGNSKEGSADELQGPGRYVPQRVSEERLTVALEGACENTSEMGPQYFDKCAVALHQNRDAVEEYLFKNGANGFHDWFCVDTLEACPSQKDEL